MNIQEIEKGAVINKILDERQRYFLHFGEEPNYVVIPMHYKCLLDLEIDINFSTECRYYGMKVIESKNCESVKNIKVY